MSAITVKDIAELLGISKQAVTKKAKKEGWLHKVGPNRTKLYYIEQLPLEIQKAFVKDMNITSEILPMLQPEAAIEAVQASSFNGSTGSVQDTWSGDNALNMDVIRDPKVVKWTRIVQEAMNKPQGYKKRAWINEVAERNNTTASTIYRKISKYKKAGLSGLKHTKHNGQIVPKAWDQEAIDWWVGLNLKKEHRLSLIHI